jgi:hypothetical protein
MSVPGETRQPSAASLLMSFCRLAESTVCNSLYWNAAVVASVRRNDATAVGMPLMVTPVSR